MNFLDTCRLNQVPNRHVLLSDVPDGHLPGKCRHYGHKVIVCGEQAPFDKAVHYYPDSMLDAGFPSNWVDVVVSYIPIHCLDSITDQIRDAERVLKLGGELMFFVPEGIVTACGMELHNRGFQNTSTSHAWGHVWMVHGTKVNEIGPSVTIPHTVTGAYCAVGHMREYFAPEIPRVYVGEFGKSPWFLTEWLSAIPHITYAGVNRSVSCDSDLWRDYLNDGLLEENVLGCDWFFGPATEPDSSFQVFQSVNQQRCLKRFRNKLGNWAFVILPNRLTDDDRENLQTIEEVVDLVGSRMSVVLAGRQSIKNLPENALDWTGGSWDFDSLYAMIRGSNAFVDFGTGHGAWASHEGVPMFDIDDSDSLLEGVEELCAKLV